MNDYEIIPVNDGDYEPMSDEQITWWEHFGRYDEESRPWHLDEASVEYQDLERNR